MAQQKLWLLAVVVVAVVGNFPLDKTIRVFLARLEPRKAETDKAKAVAMVLAEVVVVVAKMVVQAG
jgi:hypothetical protein